MPRTLPEELLQRLVAELDNENVTGIMVGGSYARGEATPYSDVDIAVFFKEGIKPGPKRFFYREGYLISVKMTSVGEIRGTLKRPRGALIAIGGWRRILLDKEGEVAKLLAEIAAFRWEAVKAEADWTVSWEMMLAAEEVHKILSAFFSGNREGMAFTSAKLLSWLTQVVVMHFGLLIKSDSTLYRQVEETVGRDAAWTRYHRLVAGIESGGEGAEAIQARGVAVLKLYKETVALVRDGMEAEHAEVVEQTLEVIKNALSELGIPERI